MKYIFLRQEKIILVKKILDFTYLDQYFLDSILILFRCKNICICWIKKT